MNQAQAAIETLDAINMGVSDSHQQGVSASLLAAHLAAIQRAYLFEHNLRALDNAKMLNNYAEVARIQNIMDEATANTPKSRAS